MMNDVLCPVCGHANPDLVEKCQSCGAVLEKKPTRPLPPNYSADMLEGLSHLEDDEEDEDQLPDWLKNIQNSLTGSVELVPTNKPLSAPELPVGQVIEPQEPEPSANILGETNAATLDWLDALSPRAETRSSESAFGSDSPKPEPDQAIYADLPDWLAALTSTNQQPTAPNQAESAVPEKQPDLAGDHSDWLSSLGGDFISEEPTAADDQGSSIKSETPDWLERMSAEAASPGMPSQSEITSSASPIPDWLSEMQNAVQSPVQSVIPDGAAVSAPDDLPGWLAALQNSSSAAGEPNSEPVVPGSEALTQPGDLPDWFSNLQASSQAPVEPEGVQSGSVAPAPEFGTLPDWLSNSQSVTQPTIESGVGSAAEQTATLEPGILPDWLSGLQGDLQNPVESLPIPEAQEPINTPPFVGMLNSTSSEEQTSSEPVFSEEKPFDTDDLVGIVIPNMGNDLPDWISNLVMTEQVEPEPGKATVSSVSSDGEAIPFLNTLVPVVQPDAISALSPSVGETNNLPISDEEQNIDSILSMDTPDWLSGFKSSEPESSDAKPELETKPEPNDLSSEELPSWVQAMRPMAAFVSQTVDADDQNIENQGPLAGLRSVLPTQPSLVEVHPSKAYSTKLFTNETQQAQAALLENLLKSENTPQIFSKRSEKRIVRPLRWLIASVLLLVVIVTIALGSKIFPGPAKPAVNSPVGMFFNTVTGLPDGAPVLVVLDYEPGFAGELEIASMPVFEQLMSKNSRLVFVSSSPLGGLMAERLIQKLARVHAYQEGTQYINLGYLPGGAAGIKAFADEPGSTLGSDALDGNMWNSPVLKNVVINSEIRLSNFTVLIVATDNPDTGRLWIEQAQPVLMSKPMLMIVSAQAEPMIYPYLLSGQVNGLVSGLEGGMLYESVRGVSGQARENWDAFGAGILLTELFILVGGVWSLISGLLARRALNEQDEA